jgi:hypothetical protein
MSVWDSYISEAAASLLDQRLHLHIVPRTELVSLSSPVSPIRICFFDGFLSDGLRLSSMTGWIETLPKREKAYQKRSDLCNIFLMAIEVRLRRFRCPDVFIWVI